MAINVQSLQIKLLINNGILFLIKLNLTCVIGLVSTLLTQVQFIVLGGII